MLPRRDGLKRQMRRAAGPGLRESRHVSRVVHGDGERKGKGGVVQQQQRAALVLLFGMSLGCCCSSRAGLELPVSEAADCDPASTAFW